MAWNSDGNFDRHDAVIMLMLLREDKLRLSGGDPQGDNEEDYQEDEFFTMNYSEEAEPNRFMESMMSYDDTVSKYRRKVTDYNN